MATAERASQVIDMFSYLDNLKDEKDKAKEIKKARADPHARFASRRLGRAGTARAYPYLSVYE